MIILHFKYLETLISQKLVQRLCVSDLDRLKIKKMSQDINNIVDSKKDLTIKNTSLKVLNYSFFIHYFIF